MKCYNCDTILENNGHECQNCKRKLKKNKQQKEFISSEEVGKCSKCSCVLEEKWNFCPICGDSVDFYYQQTNTPPAIAISAGITAENNLQKNNNAIKVEEDNAIKEVKKNCPNCNNLVSENHEFCAVCGHAIAPVTGVDCVKNDKEDKKYLSWIGLSVLLLLVGAILMLTDASLVGIGCGLASLFSIIYAKINYPNNKLVTVFFGIIIVLLILAILIPIIIIIWFVVACTSCINEYEQLVGVAWNIFTLL